MLSPIVVAVIATSVGSLLTLDHDFRSGSTNSIVPIGVVSALRPNVPTACTSGKVSSSCMGTMKAPAFVTGGQSFTRTEWVSSSSRWMGVSESTIAEPTNETIVTIDAQNSGGMAADSKSSSSTTKNSVAVDYSSAIVGFGGSAPLVPHPDKGDFGR